MPSYPNLVPSNARIRLSLKIIILSSIICLSPIPVSSSDSSSSFSSIEAAASSSTSSSTSSSASISPASQFSFNSSCVGPRTPQQLSEHLWGDNSNYEKGTRPNFADWAATGSGKVAASPPSSTDENLDVVPDVVVRPDFPAQDIVKVQVVLEGIKNVDSKTSTFQLIAKVRQIWSDARLSYKTQKDGGGCFPNKGRQGFCLEKIENIWTPDVYVVNEVSSNILAGAFWIYPNGTVVYERSFDFKLLCSMNLDRFPLDVQECKLELGMLLKDSNDIILETYSEPIKINFFFGDPIEWELKDYQKSIDPQKIKSFSILDSILD